MSRMPTSRMPWLPTTGAVSAFQLAPIELRRIGTGCTRVDINGKIGENFDKILSRPREPKPDDRFHYTVAARPHHVNPPDPCTRETETLETTIWP